MGRKIKYSSDYERKQASKESKAKYMLNKEWRCPVCNNRDYSLAGKWQHLNTKKHFINTQYMNHEGNGHELVEDEDEGVIVLRRKVKN